MIKTSLTRRIHHVHWHASMYLAIAAVLLATTKTSAELAKSLEHHMATTMHVNAVLESTHQREAENPHLPIILSGGIKLATSSGQ